MMQVRCAMRSSAESFQNGGQGPLHRLRATGWASRIDSFMRSPWYIVMLSCMTVVSNLLAWDLYLYTAFIAIGGYIALLGADMLPMMPIVMLCYIAPAVHNNPGRESESIFYPQNGGIYLIVLASLFVMCLITRLSTDKEIGWKHFFTVKRKLLSGMVLLGVTYLLSGIGMSGYSALAGKNLLFAALQFVAIILLYFIFAGTVKWSKAPKDYLAWMGMCVGFVVMAQLLENYLSGRIFMNGSGTIDRELISTGWGMHNNVGGLMAMMLPFPFYLAYTKKHGWVYSILASILLGGVIISCSRTSMVVAAATFCVCAFLLIRNKHTRKANLCVFAVMAVGAMVAAVVFFQKLLEVFALFFEELFEVSQRDNLFHYGMKQFLEHPIFGGSFFPQGEYVPWDWSDLESFTSFFPPRWHNTLVQVAASCGVVGLVGYGVHRYQTIKLLLKDFSREKLFIGLYVAVLLICGLMDCHFFNIGPVLFYSMALAFAENIHQSQV